MKRLVLSLFVVVWGCDSGVDNTVDPQTNRMMEQPGPPTAGPSPDPMAPMAPQTPAQGSENQDPVATPTDVQLGPQREAAIRHPEVIEPPSRARRRMNLDQLEAAIRRVSGGLNWTEQRGANEVRLFEELSTTLGKPDFIQVTTEVLEPTALFQKFLGDAARQVCAKMVDRDMARQSQATLVIEDTDSEAVDAHLRALVLRFHHVRLQEDSRNLAQWRWLFDSVVLMTESAAERWNAVCVALFTHPDFYSY